MSALLAGLMLLTAAGGALGGNATEALFFARFGTQQLPLMYVILGLFTFATSVAVTAVMGRVSKQRLFVTLPLLLSLLIVVEWLVIPFNFRPFFAVMWLGMNVIFSLQGLFTWGLAGAACDTRQAKRLFPLFSAGSILGTVLGGLVTRPFATWLHSENLLLLWAGAMFLAFVLGRSLTSHKPSAQVVTHTAQPSVIEEMQRGYQFVRRSPIMRWIAYGAILFSVCFYSLALPFSRGAAVQFPDADQLAGFLGLFQSLNTVAALLVSLFLANRLFARFGILPMLLIFPVIYLAGFAILAVFAPFTMLVAVRFAQMAYMNGIAATAWQTMFNVVPPEQRDQVRAFISGVPEQAGTLIAGLTLFAGEQALEPQQLYLVGLFAAALLVYTIWRASRAYRQALVEALREGQPQVFFDEEQPFGGASSDAAAVSVAIRGLDHPDPSIRRISAEIVGHIQSPEAADALTNALRDDDAAVRAAAIKGLCHTRPEQALDSIRSCLSDPDADVRRQALDSLRTSGIPVTGNEPQIAPLLSDRASSVRARAALILLEAGEHTRAKETLLAMAEDADPLVRAQALDALGTCGDPPAFDLAASALTDVHPVVRNAAIRALVRIHPQSALVHLIGHLNDEDSTVRQTLAEAFEAIGEPALEPIVDMLVIPSFEDAVLTALERLPAHKAEGKLRAYAEASARAALQYRNLAYGIARAFLPRSEAESPLQLLVESLHDRSRHCGTNALKALGLVLAHEAITVAIENLVSRDASQRANALETLEAVGERDIIRPLLALWEPGDAPAASLPEGWLENLLDDPSAWLRACAVLAAGRANQSKLYEKLSHMSQHDPDAFIRDAAKYALNGDSKMETMSTLSLMERILFLRRVPLFSDLAPADLKQVAGIASEYLFSDQQVLARQGELGSEMYIVVSGEVRVLVTPENQSKPREVARRRSGDYVGEMAVINQEPRIATLVAEGPVRVLCLKQKHFQSILHERPEIGLAMLRILSQRLKEASLQVY